MASASQPGQPPPHKRARVQAGRDNDDYMRGNITKISVCNFMTYSEITSHPGPRLNLVIGPNGTGKSSLVCAIAIGLGGDPQILGRAGHIGDYVKRGEETGWVEITLRGDSSEESIVVRRTIHKSNKSDWLLNGKPSTKRAISETVQRFNIQVNNLTQFLPQDRVCEFAKMTPIELLVETEKAVGDPELSSQHERLITLNTDLKQRQNSVRQIENKLNQHKSNNAELEKDVERVQERNRLYEKAESMRKKLPWLQYSREYSVYEEALGKEREAKTRRDQVTRQLAETMEPIKEKKSSKLKADNAVKKLRETNSSDESKRKELLRVDSEMNAQVKAKLSEMEELRRSEAARAEKIAAARRQVEEAEEELANFRLSEPPRDQIEELGSKIQELELLVQEKKRGVEDLERMGNQKRIEISNCEKRLAAIQDVTNQRLELLKRSGCQRISEAFQWVNRHRDQFKRDVYGPVLLEVNIQNRNLAGFVEGQVANYIWKALITQSAEDRDLLVRNLKEFEVPVINFTGEERLSQGSSVTSQMASLGVSGTLDQVIQAPQVVKDVLVGQFGLNYSFYGSALANEKADEICQLGIRDLWTPENHFRWQESRYGGHRSAMVNPVRPARLFSQNVDTREVDQLQQRKIDLERSLESVIERRKALLAEQSQLDNQASELHKDREQLVNRGRTERKRRLELVNRIDVRKKRLQTLETEENVQTAVNRLKKAVSDLNVRRCKKSLELKEVLIRSVKNQMRYTIQYLCAAELDVIVKHMDKEFKAQEQAGVEAEQAYNDCKAERRNCHERVERAKSHAESVATLTPELQDAFQNMPDTIEDLEDAINSAHREATEVFCRNPNVLQEYEQRCRQIEELTTKLEQEQAGLNSCSEEMDRIQTTWLSTLRDSVTKINSSFSRNFREMAVAGEVSLDEHGTNFDEYGIHIKVKFRENGQLQVLSGHHQSGGERSVSTILYLVSLQDLTHCPFRVVDEINQGMDPFNERKMFQQLVRAASQPNTPQCFLLTPKLLPDLEYSEACTILYIMNGPWIDKASEVWKNGERWAEQFMS